MPSSVSTILCSLETADHSGKLAIGEASKLGHEPPFALR